MASNTFSKAVTDWELLTTTVAVNVGDLAYLEPIRVELEGVLRLAMNLGVQQDRQQSEVQQTSRMIEDTIRKGESLAARLRAGIRAQYGYKNEKLTEFQIRPIRRRSRTPEDPPPGPEAPAPDPTVLA
ncbi:MAG TPA: hypothetical protein VH394_17160 [Thermoanaerobaculia bacterium]|jgi:hypothetical protein|nr:hypothetical protein [Thermoanaerobaculia bacterium]